MIKVENTEVWGFEGAIRGMRNPKNSWSRSDSEPCFYNGCGRVCEYCLDQHYVVGKNDMDLMRRLFKAGTEHRKYLRMIHVQMDITAPLYWWKEFDTYKVGTVANSCSTMHKIHDKEFTLDDFSHEHLMARMNLMDTIDTMNHYREFYLESRDKDYWWQMVQLLPTSYNQKRTVDMNYENVMTIIRQRSNHKLDEWNQLVTILKELPYVKEIREEDTDVD